MAYSYTVDERGEVLVVAFEGVIESRDELAEKVGQVMKEAVLRNSKRVFVDDRKLEIIVTDEVADNLAREMEGENLQMLDIRFACLCKPTELDMYLFFETHHQDRGLEFKAFTDEDAAMEWLRS